MLSFGLYTYLDKAEFYQDIVVIVISTNLAAHLLPALILRRFQGTGNPFATRLVEILLPSLISIAVYVTFVSIVNILTVPHFLQNISLFRFILFNLLAQFIYALVSALTATLILGMNIRPRYADEDKAASRK